MNPKDKNLLKGLAILLTLGAVVFKVGLSIFGDPLRLLGALCGGYGGVRALISLYKAMIEKPADPTQSGKWAVVTGCTGGLGQEFVNRIASRGMNLVLISRSMPKLEVLAAEMKAKYGVECTCLAFDFAQCSPEQEDNFYTKILPEFVAKAPIGGDLGLLVNNVGVGDEVLALLLLLLLLFFSFFATPSAPPLKVFVIAHLQVCCVCLRLTDDLFFRHRHHSP